MRFVGFLSLVFVAIALADVVGGHLPIPSWARTALVAAAAMGSHALADRLGWAPRREPRAGRPTPEEAHLLDRHLEGTAAPRRSERRSSRTP